MLEAVLRADASSTVALWIVETRNPRNDVSELMAKVYVVVLVVR